MKIKNGKVKKEKRMDNLQHKIKKRMLLILVLIMTLAILLPGLAKAQEPTEVTITFETEGGKPLPKSQKIQASSKITDPGTVKKDNMLFLGWADKENPEVIFDLKTPVEKDTTLVAKWVPQSITVVTILFDAAGGNPVPEAQILATGEKMTEPQNPEKEGFVFSGWYKSGSHVPYDFNDPVYESKTLIAKWELGPVIPVTVTFDAVLGTPVPEVQTLAKGEKASMPKAPTKGNMVFLGWYETEDSKVPYDFNRSVINSLNLKARWGEAPVAEVKLSFDSKGGSYAPHTQILKPGGKGTEPKAPTKTGYHFLGWYESEEAKTRFDFDTPITKDRTLIGKWTKVEEKTYTLKFDTKGGKPEIQQQIIKEGTVIKNPGVPQKTNAKFLGWYEGDSAKTAFDFNTKITKDMNLVAKWEEQGKPTPVEPEKPKKNNNMMLIGMAIVLILAIIGVVGFLVMRKKKQGK